MLTPSSRPEQSTKAVLSLLDEVEQIIKDTPPVENGMSRFGNPAFRTFYDAVAAVCPLSFPFLER
jgi:serine/threonine-protein phosphatase 2A activator